MEVHPNLLLAPEVKNDGVDFDPDLLHGNFDSDLLISFRRPRHAKKSLVTFKVSRM